MSMAVRRADLTAERWAETKVVYWVGSMVDHWAESWVGTRVALKADSKAVTMVALLVEMTAGKSVD